MTSYLALVSVLFIEYIRPGIYFSAFEASKIGTILPLGLLAFSFMSQTKTSHSDIWESGNARWLAFFLFLILVSLFTADVTFYAYIRITQTSGYFFLFYIICIYTDNLQKVKGILFSMVMIHILLIVLNPDIVLHPEIRNYMTAGPFLGDGNDFALSLCIVFPMCIFLLLDSTKKLQKIFFILMLLTIAFAIVGTQSRGATLGVASILFYLWWESKNKIIGIITVSILVVTMFVFAPPEYFSRMETMDHYEEDGSAMGRINAWKHATELGLENPILGVGAGGFPALHGLTAHSMYFLVFAELGFPGIIYLIIFLLQILWRNNKNIQYLKKSADKEDKMYKNLFICLNAGVIGFAVSGAFLSVLYNPQSFVIGGITLAANSVYRKYEKEKINRGKPTMDKDNNKKQIKKFVRCR